MIAPLAWPCPTPSGALASELALAADHGRDRRLLIVPALFDEGNKLRRFTVEVMRRLDAAGIDCLLPDLPGLNESAQPLAEQTPAHWRAVLESTAARFEASHVLAIRGGGLVAPAGLPGWRYAPVSGAAILRQMIRARTIAAREAGREETHEALLAEASEQGIELAGYSLNGSFVRQFLSLTPLISAMISDVPQESVSESGGLWLRAEPGENRAQADALAAIVAIGIRA